MNHMDNNPQRIDEFKEEIHKMDLRPPEDSRERLWLMAGLLLVVVGIVITIVAYALGSGTANTADQFSYLMNGLIGVAVTIGGAALFVRYSLSRYLRFWLLRSIYEDRAQTDRTVEALGRVEDLLRTATKPRSNADR
jgi:hypothetical protein